MKKKETSKDNQNQRHLNTTNTTNKNIGIEQNHEKTKKQVLIAQQCSNHKMIERDMLSRSGKARENPEIILVFLEVSGKGGAVE